MIQSPFVSRITVIVTASLLATSGPTAVASEDQSPSRSDRASSRTREMQPESPKVAARPRAEPTAPPLEVGPNQGVTPAGLPSWIVMLAMRPDPNDPQRVAAAESLVDAVLADTIGVGREHQRYAHGLVGFAAGMTPAEAGVVAADPRVAFVEPDRISTLNRIGDGGEPVGENPNLPVPWNLRRISTPDGLAPTFEPCGANGAGVTAVVIDSGVRLDHSEFAGRIVANRSFALTGPPNGSDIEGHGTHVAGTFAGSTVGVAPQADIVSLRVVEVFGEIFDSSWIAAVNWTLVPGNVARPAVINMSLGGAAIGLAPAQTEILELAVLSGVPVVVSAGNNSYLASWTYPASIPFAITVGATDLGDWPSPFSNHGSIVDIWAPGGGIVSADWLRPDGGLTTKSGTSMASPCVAGAVVLFMQQHVTAEDLANGASMISGRAAIWLARNAANGVLSDRSDPWVVSPGGNGTLGGAANRLLQVCTTSTGIVCDEPLEWHDGVAAVVFGDGIAPLGEDAVCERVIWSPDGPVALTVNWVSIDVDLETGLAANITITDVATGQVLWSSDNLDAGQTYQSQWLAANRFALSSSNAGLRVRWEGRPGHEIVGYGYVMTARAMGACPGDLNGDSVVDGTDLGVLFGTWGPCPINAACPGDLTGDGMVGPEDLSALLGGWGACPGFVPAPYAMGCNGELIHKSFVGDSYLDCESRGILPSPVLYPTTVSIASACCEAVGFDLVPGNPVGVGISDELGACIGSDGSCTLATTVDCAIANGLFVGRGLDCNAMGPLLDAAALPCPAEAISTGWAIDWTNWGDSPVSLALSAESLGRRWRQEIPPGVNSIESLAFPASISTLSGGNPNASFLGQGSGYRVPMAELMFEVLIEFTDGGEPIVVERIARASPIASADVPQLFQAYFLFTLEEVLPDIDREVKSIEIGCYRETPLVVSDVVAFLFAGRAAVSGEPLAEYSPDGGRTWLVGELPLQLGLCITP